ncbi:MAG: hypothetical protein WKF84_26775 [Pyrinomonadaceae bacterium]
MPISKAGLAIINAGGLGIEQTAASSDGQPYGETESWQLLRRV